MTAKELEFVYSFPLTLSSRFIAMFLLAIVIATPLAYWITNNWLQDFAYRINFSGWIFLIAGSTAGAIALATVSFQAIKSCNGQPGKRFKNGMSDTPIQKRCPHAWPI